MRYIIAFLLGVIVASIIYTSRVQPQLRAIVGEASGEGYQGMLAVACALKNRGSLEGVYGVNAPHLNSEPPWVWKMARKAYFVSLTGIDITDGATHWESTDFPEPRWAKSMTMTKHIGKHKFYKEVE